MKQALVLFFCFAGCTTSIDFDAGRPYACEPDAGGDSCGAGWRCGLEQRCHRIGDARAWRCGVDDDCEASWVCGRNQTCHDPAVPADYECVADDDCVAPWRCGLDGRCLDATSEAIDFDSSAPGAARRINPLLPDGARKLGATDFAVAIAAGPSVYWIADSRLLLTVEDAGVGFSPTAIVPDLYGALAYVDGGATGFYLPGYSNLVTPFDAGAIPLNLGGPWLLERDELQPVGGLRVGGVRKVGAETFAAAVIGSCLVSVDLSGLWVQPDQGLPVLQKQEELMLGGSSNTQCSIRSQLNDRVDLLRARQERAPLLAFRTTTQNTFSGAGIETVSVYDVTGLITGDEACVPTPPPSTSLVPCGDARSTQRLQCPSPCEAGDELVDLRPTETGLEVHCLGTSGPAAYSLAYDGRCEARRLEGRPRFAAVDLGATREAKAFSPHVFLATGLHGEIWWGANLETARSLTLDEPPLGARADAWLGREENARFEPRLGLLTKPTAERAAVVPASDLEVLTSGSVVRVQPDGGTARVASLGRLLSRDDEVHAVTSADGGILIATVDDQVFIGTREEWLPRLPSAVTPAPGLPLRALALDGDDAWVSTESGAWKLVSNRGNWTAQPMKLPAGRVLEVWVEAAGRRVAMRDGQVLSLPNGVRLVAALPDGEALVDVQPACGQLFGLTRRGLMRVEAQRWVAVPFTLPAGPALFDTTLAEGRLFFSNGELALFNGAGVAAALPVQCD